MSDKCAPIHAAMLKIENYGPCPICGKSQFSAASERITELEALLKARDGGGHDRNCGIFRLNYKPCTCGHDAVAKYFEGVGK